MNPILKEIITTGTTQTINGEKKKVIGQISEEEGNLIQKSIKEINAETSVEVGLAFGTSALYICEALSKTQKTRHFVIDPYQMYEESYAGIGLNNLNRAGYGNFVEFMDKPSHQSLAELELRNIIVDFAFIDGWHTFDHALIDFFLVDRILRVGGIVILDDTDWPSLQKVCSFISNNRAFEFIGGSAQRSYLDKKNNSITLNNSFKKIKTFLKNKGSDRAEIYGAMAFRKISNDTRSWDHYVSF